MRSAFRSLTFGLAATFGGAAMAQQPFTIVIDGLVTNCYTGQTVNVQTIQGTQPVWNFDVPVDPNTCTWSATLPVASNPAWYMVSTLCNGMIVSMSDSTGFGSGDSTYVSVTLNCGNILVYDCLGMPNGPNMPGTACDDGNPATGGDVWSPSCVCAGSDTSGTFDCLGVLNGPNMPGTWCISFFGDTGVWSVDCICQTNNQIDCEGNPGGGALPGTPCVWNNQPGTWSVDCVCTPDSGGVYDCTGVLNGPNMPGAVCDDGNPMTVQDHWDANCICSGTLTSLYDCLGEIGGSALPGTPCVVPGTVIVGTWSADCVCETNTTEPCEANFWVLQAWGQDSLPIPYELWVWNLSSGGSGNYTYFWDFGDGSSSMDAYPTHTYAGSGPYNLCLTIADDQNCTDTYCDSVSIDGNGILNGMVVQAEDRQDGFTINVQNPSANAISENAFGEIAAWPNPASEVLNVALSSAMSANAMVTITDLNGRVVLNERRSLNNGRSQFTVDTEALGAGMYLLRVNDGPTNVSIRFVKAH